MRPRENVKRGIKVFLIAVRQGQAYTGGKEALHMRRTDREMHREFALTVLDKCEYMVLSMTDGDGAPYCVPVNGVRDGEDIYFHCALRGEKIDCLRARPRVCLCAVGETRVVQEEFTTEYECALARGTAAEVTADEEKIHALRLICLHYAPDNMENFDSAVERSLRRTGIWKIHMDNITGKRKKYGKDGRELKFGETE